MSEVAKNEHSRLCHIVKCHNYDGYGFDLQAEKGKLGQYIGKVDGGSPAKAAGLRQGDRIIAVNGESIAGKSHKQVVDLIKAMPNEAKLLVVDDDDNEHETIIIPETETNGNGVAKNNIEVTNANHVQQQNGKNHTAAKESNHQVDANHFDDDVDHSSATMKREENGALNLNMTAAELRARLAAKKRFDPRKETMDFKKKFEMVQKL